MRIALALLFSLIVPAAALAAEEPEVVYGKFHRAIVSGDLDGMLDYAIAAQRREIANMSAAQRTAQVKMMAVLMPRAVVLKDKSVNADGKSARLLMSGMGQTLVGDKPETLWGSIRMVVEGKDWKVADVNWSNNPPANLPQAAPKAAPSGKAAQTPVPPKSAAPVIGSMDSAPERKLGTQKPPCVYKAVMTAEDMENCR